jgi:hypothetical protein
VGLAAAKEFHGRAYTEHQRLQIAYYADAIRSHFVAPASLGVFPILADVQPAPAGAKREDPGRGVLDAELVLIVGEKGRIGELAWQKEPLVRPLSDAIVKAAREANAAGDFDGIMAMGGKSRADTLVVSVLSSHSDGDIQLPLMRARVPVYVADSWPAVLKAPVPEFPPEALAARVGGQVDVVFVIGSNASVVPSSVQFVRADWRDFIAPIRRALMATQFRAGRSGGCAIPTMVRQPFAFRINPP